MIGQQGSPNNWSDYWISNDWSARLANNWSDYWISNDWSARLANNWSDAKASALWENRSRWLSKATLPLKRPSLTKSGIREGAVHRCGGLVQSRARRWFEQYGGGR
eukprot:3706957-Pyramimonas_sp.AAC.1